MATHKERYFREGRYSRDGCYFRENMVTLKIVNLKNTKFAYCFEISFKKFFIVGTKNFLNVLEINLKDFFVKNKTFSVTSRSILGIVFCRN